MRMQFTPRCNIDLDIRQDEKCESKWEDGENDHAPDEGVEGSQERHYLGLECGKGTGKCEVILVIKQCRLKDLEIMHDIRQLSSSL